MLDRLARLPWLSNVTLVSSTSGRATPDTSGTCPAATRSRSPPASTRTEVRNDRPDQRAARPPARGRGSADPSPRRLVRRSSRRSGRRPRRSTGRSTTRASSSRRRRRSCGAPRRTRASRTSAACGVALPDDVKMSEILRQLAWASRVSGVSIDQHHAVPAGCVDRGAGGADRALGQRPLLPDREVHAPAPDAGRGEGRQGACVGAAVRHRQHLVLERRQGPDHGDARARRVRLGRRRRRRRRRTSTTTTTTDDGRSGLGGGNQAPGSATSARIAAKQRRQKIVVGVLAVVLVALLAYEVPHMLKRSSNASSSAAPPAPASTPRRRTAHAARRVGERRRPVRRQVAVRTATPASRRGGPDPFTAPGVDSSSAATSPLALPQQIVIGRPGGHRVAKHGWIVILASIPTRSGRGSAVRFARECAPQRRWALGPQLVQPPTAARRLLGRLLRPLRDARGGLATRGRRPRRRLPDRLHPRAHRVPVTRLRTCLRAEEGMTLVELLIAMVVMSIGITAIVAGFSSGILAVDRAKRRHRPPARSPTSRWSSTARRPFASVPTTLQTATTPTGPDGTPTGCRSTDPGRARSARIPRGHRRPAPARPQAVRSSS